MILRAAAIAAVLLAQQQPPAGPAEKPLKVMMALQDAQARYEAQLLGDLDRPVGDGIVLGTTQYAAEVDDKGNLRIDTKAEEKYRTITRREIVSFQVKGDTDKSKTATAGVDKTIVLRLPGNKATGAWQITNLGGDSIQSVGKSQYVAGNPNGAFIFRFKAVKPGKTNLKLAYVRQGDKSTRPANTFTVDLVVRK